MDPQTIFYIVVGVLYLIYNMYRTSQKNQLKRKTELEKARREQQGRTYEHSAPVEVEEPSKKKHWFEEVLEQEFGEFGKEESYEEAKPVVEVESPVEPAEETYQALEYEPIVRQTTQQKYDQISERKAAKKAHKLKVEETVEMTSQVAEKAFDLREAVIQQAILERPHK